MKKLIVLAGLLLVMAHSAFAERRGVFMEFHRKSNPDKNLEVNRTPMRLPIDVIYNSSTHTIEVIGNKSTYAEVFLYDNTNGILRNCSSSLNTSFMIFTPGSYIILINGDGWYAEGEIEV